LQLKKNLFKFLDNQYSNNSENNNNNNNGNYERNYTNIDDNKNDYLNNYNYHNQIDEEKLKNNYYNSQNNNNNYDQTPKENEIENQGNNNNNLKKESISTPPIKSPVIMNNNNINGNYQMNFQQNQNQVNPILPNINSNILPIFSTPRNNHMSSISYNMQNNNLNSPHSINNLPGHLRNISINPNPNNFHIQNLKHNIITNRNNSYYVNKNGNHIRKQEYRQEDFIQPITESNRYCKFY
jgi:hypothetical protein